MLQVLQVLQGCKYLNIVSTCNVLTAYLIFVTCTTCSAGVKISRLVSKHSSNYGYFTYHHYSGGGRVVVVAPPPPLQHHHHHTLPPPLYHHRHHEIQLCCDLRCFVAKLFFLAIYAFLVSNCVLKIVRCQKITNMRYGCMMREWPHTAPSRDVLGCTMYNVIHPNTMYIPSDLEISLSPWDVPKPEGEWAVKPNTSHLSAVYKTNTISVCLNIVCASLVSVEV